MGIIRSNADLEGDNTPIPNKGTGTNVDSTTFGYDISVDATNSRGSITGATKSDAGMEGNPDCCNGM